MINDYLTSISNLLSIIESFLDKNDNVDNVARSLKKVALSEIHTDGIKIHIYENKVPANKFLIFLRS